MSDIVQASKRQQIQMLKEQTRLTGALHEAQVLQLKIWPLVLFQNAAGSEFTWDPDTKVVIFKLDLKKRQKAEKPAWWKERVEALNTWVQTLLGEEWMIQVDTASKTFKGARKIVDVRSHRSPDAGAVKRSSSH